MNIGVNSAGTFGFAEHPRLMYGAGLPGCARPRILFCTAPYAWDVVGTALAALVFTPPFTPKHGPRMPFTAQTHVHTAPYGEAFESEDDRHSVGML